VAWPRLKKYDVEKISAPFDTVSPDLFIVLENVIAVILKEMIERMKKIAPELGRGGKYFGNNYQADFC